MDAFTEDEKRFVLAEYIKSSQVGTGPLVQFIEMHDLQADWLAMQLPGGRNMHQCMRAASQLLDRELQPPNLPLLKRKSVGDLNEHVPKRIPSMTPILPFQPQPPGPHSQQPQQQQQLQQPLTTSRTLQPRPPADPKQPVVEGYGVFQSQSPSNGQYSVFQANPTARKRGRPSRAEKEAQARANSASYTTSTPVSISPKPAVSQSVGVLPMGHATSRSALYAPGPADPRSAIGTQAGSVFLKFCAEQPTAGRKSEKSPTIKNLVTADPTTEESKKSTTSLIGSPFLDASPTKNSG